MQLIISNIQVKQRGINGLPAIIILILLLPIIMIIIGILLLAAIILVIYLLIMLLIKAVFTKKQVIDYEISEDDDNFNPQSIDVIDRDNLKIKLIECDYSKHSVIEDEWTSYVEGNNDFCGLYHLEVIPYLKGLEGDYWTHFYRVFDNEVILLQRVIKKSDKSLTSELVAINYTNQSLDILGEIGQYFLTLEEYKTNHLIITGINQDSEIEIVLKTENKSVSIEHLESRK